MENITVKRVYEPASDQDGYRVLVDRLWPRGIKKENLHYDIWEKDVTPSSSLRQWFHEDPEDRWKDFQKKYSSELSASEAAKDFAKKIKGKKTVTLLYAAKDEKHSHALVLKDFLERQI